MFAYWTGRGRPHLPCMEIGQSTAYISDIGSYSMKPIFLIGTIIATVAFQISYSILIDWILRFTSRKGHRSTADAEVAFTAVIAILSTLGVIGAILLALFDKAQYHRPHQIFLGFYL